MKEQALGLKDPKAPSEQCVTESLLRILNYCRGSCNIKLSKLFKVPLAWRYCSSLIFVKWQKLELSKRLEYTMTKRFIVDDMYSQNAMPELCT